MGQDTINDLKQFITATFAQQATKLKTELKTELKAELKTEIVAVLRADIHRLDLRIDGLSAAVVELRTDLQRLDDRLSKKIDDLSTSVGEALHTSNEVIGVQLNDHERRLTRLEKKGTGRTARAFHAPT